MTTGAKWQHGLIIDEAFLASHPEARFVFGDNLQRAGLAGGARLRHHPQSVGFCTKKNPGMKPQDFFKPEEYRPLFFDYLDQLENIISANQQLVFYISRVGAGLANRYRIWELLIKPNMERELSRYNNVVFCWEEPYRE